MLGREPIRSTSGARRAVTVSWFMNSTEGRSVSTGHWSRLNNLSFFGGRRFNSFVFLLDGGILAVRLGLGIHCHFFLRGLLNRRQRLLRAFKTLTSLFGFLLGVEIPTESSGFGRGIGSVGCVCRFALGTTWTGVWHKHPIRSRVQRRCGWGRHAKTLLLLHPELPGVCKRRRLFQR